MQIASIPHLDGQTKGLPAGLDATAVSDVGSRGWNVLAEDLPLPLALLKDSALAHNAAGCAVFVN